MFELQIATGGRVRLVGRLDAAQAGRALDELTGLPGPLVLDCAELDYVSSAGIGVLVETHKRMVRAGTTLRLVNVPHRVRNVLALANLDRVLTLE